MDLIELPDTHTCICAVTYNITLYKAWRCMHIWSYFQVRFVGQIKVTNASMLIFKSVCVGGWGGWSGSQQGVSSRCTERIYVTLAFPSWFLSLSLFLPLWSCPLSHVLYSCLTWKGLHVWSSDPSYNNKTAWTCGEFTLGLKKRKTEDILWTHIWSHVRDQGEGDQSFAHTTSQCVTIDILDHFTQKDQSWSSPHGILWNLTGDI